MFGPLIKHSISHERSWLIWHSFRKDSYSMNMCIDLSHILDFLVGGLMAISHNRTCSFRKRFLFHPLFVSIIVKDTYAPWSSFLELNKLFSLHTNSSVTRKTRLIHFLEVHLQLLQILDSSLLDIEHRSRSTRRTHLFPPPPAHHPSKRPQLL